MGTSVHLGAALFASTAGVQLLHVPYGGGAKVMVAVYAVMLAPVYGADEGTVFLASLAHHLHNALLPDSGFTGEMLLGPALEPAFAEATRQALDELDAPLRAAVEEARRGLPDAETPEGRAFHAADTLDRVLQIEQYLRAASTSMHFVLGDMALVHDGPVKRFQAGLGWCALPSTSTVQKICEDASTKER